MSLGTPVPGFNQAAEFQTSALPWVTASTVIDTVTTHIEFPCVTRFISLQNVSGVDIKLGFTQNGIDRSNYTIVSASATFESELRLRHLYLKANTAATASYCLLAGLTTISFTMAPTLTSSLPAPSGTAYWPGVG